MLLESSCIAHSFPLLEKCSNMEDLKQIHAQMYKTGVIQDLLLCNKFLSFYAAPGFGNIAYARRFFDGISRPSTVMWNTMIKCYSNSDEPEEALFLYQHMMIHQSVVVMPLHNGYTFPFLLQACSKFCVLEETQQVHAHVVKFGFGFETYASNALLSVYLKSDGIGSARRLFDHIPMKDTVSWNTMIAGYAKSNDMEMAFELFENMQVRNIITWSTMMNGCVDAGLTKEALNLFHEFQVSGTKPDKVILAIALSACADLGALDQGKWIHTCIEKHKVQIDPVLSCVLISMYAKCGVLDRAEKVFVETGRKNISVWTAMITGYAIHGLGQEALNLFSEMQKRGVEPNSITLTAVLMACSYAGLVDKGKSLFGNMEKEYGLKPSLEHYGCMTDLLGRAGFLREAKELIDNMPLRPSAAIWGSLLKACRIYGDVELGKQVAMILIKMEPGHGGRYVHLAGIYAEAHNWDEANEMRSAMKDEGVVKLPGCSVICVNGTVHQFLAGARFSPVRKSLTVRSSG